MKTPTECAQSGVQVQRTRIVMRSRRTGRLPNQWECERCGRHLEVTADGRLPRHNAPLRRESPMNLTDLPTMCSMCAPRGLPTRLMWRCSYCQEWICPHILPADHQRSRICNDSRPGEIDAGEAYCRSALVDTMGPDV